jgi:hypothetical protein
VQVIQSACISIEQAEAFAPVYNRQVRKKITVAPAQEYIYLAILLQVRH